MLNQNNVFLKLAKRIGVDGAIAYSSGARIVQALAGVITIFFIATFLSEEEQGYYYTFGSILAIQIFFELGFTDVITQFVAHEASYLIIKVDGKNSYVDGDKCHISRLSHLTRFCLKWYFVIALVFFVVINVVGFIFFSKYQRENDEVEWLLPWMILSIGTSCNLILSPFSSILNGVGRVKDVATIVFYQQLAHPIIICMGLAAGLKLYSVGINSLVYTAIWFFIVGHSKLYIILKILLNTPITEKVSYTKEIFPYQWKIALSWISGYFIFQLFNPVLFATEGAIVAGQMGMTISVLNSIQALSRSWQNTKIPLYSSYIEQKKYYELDRLFCKTTRQMLFVCASLLFMFLLFVFFIRIIGISINGNYLGNRFLGYFPLILMMLPLFANQFVNSWATYVRCHLKEPFLISSIVMGVLCSVSTVYLGEIYGVVGITMGYCLLTLLIGLPWTYHIYVSKRKQWH